MPETAVSAATTHTLEWLALSLTPGLGPKKARKLAEHFGSSEAIFRASLTELESTGIKAVSAQSLATGKSMELAREEMARDIRLRRDRSLCLRYCLSTPPERNPRSSRYP